MNKLFPAILLLLLLTCHFPYLTADPDKLSDIHTRGAWTDEGLYTSQLRNALIDGRFDIKESTTFIRGPLFNIIQFPFFYLFGSHRMVSRLLVLFLTFLVPVIFLRIKGFEAFTFFFLLLVFGQFYLFHFSHYGMAEMICIDCILFALFFLINAQSDKALFGHRIAFVFFATLMVFLSYSFKIQYVYLAALLPLTLLVLALSQRSDRVETLTLFGLSAVFTAIFLCIYGVYYLLNHDFYNYIMSQETSGRYPMFLKDLGNVAWFNFGYFLWINELKPMWIAFPAAVILIIWEKHSRKGDRQVKALLTFSFLWILLELHKLPMLYLPHRYLLPLYVAIGIIIAQSLAALYSRGNGLAAAAMGLAIVLFSFSVPHHWRAFQQRSWELTKLNNYLSSHSFKGKVGLGSWACAASWDSDLQTLPVWNNYMNWKKPLETFRPAVVVTEKDESETDKVYKSQNIDLKARSDSSRTFKIWRYEVNVFWMKPY